MTPAERLLLAAKRCEIDNLEHLATTCEIVGDISRFIHALQKERGASNIYLASCGERFATRREERIVESLRNEQAIRQRPRNRITLADDPSYNRYRQEVLRFLYEKQRKVENITERRKADSAKEKQVAHA
ncbi:nitrate- and nitrite sensing domain-containing protein [Vreelandella populi]|nr:hypothetical protein HIO72_13525 [Halomonas sp. PA5]